MLDDLIRTSFFAFFLVFCRCGSAMMLLPGLGEPFISPRIRLTLGLALSLVITPLASPTLPAMPDSGLLLFLLIAGEIIIGLFIGIVARFLLSSLQVGGMAIAYQSGLANAFVRDPTSASQGALFGAFLTILGVLLIMVTDLHYIFIAALVDSYSLFIPGNPLPVDGIAETLARVVSDSFTLAIRIAAPFIVMGLVFYLGLGLLGRLMPQIQVFFIVLPVQIVLGWTVMALTVATAMALFLRSFETHYVDIFVIR
ncbi:MAG: flagellar type III secretion system protein FliR [Alphaproteobacteria bacterium]|nr:flagellar type III secretion system protein FliR [Alphaproteobacteria bacterium]